MFELTPEKQHPLSQYVIAVLIVWAVILAGIWFFDRERFATFAHVCAGFLLGMCAMYIAIIYIAGNSERGCGTTEKAKLSCAGRKVARAQDAPSRDALRGILRGNDKCALDCALPALVDGHTHEEQAARDARGGRATVFSRYSSGHLPSGVEEDCKGEIGCGWCHSFAEPFLQSLWSYPKQAGELFQAQMVLVEKDTQEPEHVIVVLLGLRFGFMRRHLMQLQDTRTYTTQLCNITWRDECALGLHR